MKIWLTLCLVTSLAGCAGQQGSYCDIYEPVKMKRSVSQHVVATDRPAAEVIAANNQSYEACK